MKKALVIGSEGQDGKLLTTLLLRKGYSVFGVGRSNSSTNPDIRYSKVDLVDPGAIRDCLSETYDEIYYLAAFHHSSVSTALNELNLVETSYAVNVLSFAVLLGALVEQKADTKVFYASSSLIYGKSGKDIQTEDTEAIPNCVYSVTKKSAMDLASYYRERYQLHIVVGIMYNHESIYRGDEFLSKKIVNQTREIVEGKRRKITIGDLNSRTDWGYAPDYVEGMWHLMQLAEPNSYIISSGTLRKVKDWFVVLYNHLGLKWENYVEEDKEMIFRIKPTLKGDNSKLLATGWSPETSFEEMVVKMYEKEI